MENKEQLRKVARNCSQYYFDRDSSLRFQAKIQGETVRSCENCLHFTEDHRCELDLIDTIISNMAELDYE